MVFIANVTTIWPDNNTVSAFPISKSLKNVSAIRPDQFMNAKQIINGIVIPLLYLAIFIVGIVANSIVVYASSIFKMTSKGAIDIYVGNLAIADLSLIATLPFWAVTHIQEGVWTFGNAMCKIVSTLTHIHMYSSIFLITAMAIDRHTVIVKGIKVRTQSLRSASRTWLKCGIIWCSTIILSIPTALFRMATTSRNASYCSWKYPENQTDLWWAVHTVERNVIGFLIPLVIICRCYVVLVSYVRSRGNETISLQSSNVRHNQQVRRITTMATTIILAFTICWLPNQMSNFIQTLMHYKVIPQTGGRTVGEVYYMLHLFFSALSFCNSVINPIIYSTSPSHRSRVKELFSRSSCFSKLHQLLFHNHRRLQPDNAGQNESPESCHRNRRTMVTRIAQNTPVSPHTTQPTSPASFHSGNAPTSLKHFGETCIGAVDSEDESLLQSPINPDIPANEHPETFNISH